MIVDLVAETLAWHEISLVRVRNRLRTAGWRYECSCPQGWQSGLFHRRRHVAEQVTEALRRHALEVVDAAGLVGAEPAGTPNDGEQGDGGGR